MPKYAKWVRVQLFRRLFLAQNREKLLFLARFGPKHGQNIEKIKNSKHKFSLYPKMLVKSKKYAKIAKWVRVLLFRRLFLAQNREKWPFLARFVLKTAKILKKSKIQNTLLASQNAS